MCCKKGGPAFHTEDADLVHNGMIQAKYLYTLRRGEWGYDPVLKKVMPLNSEIIKTREISESRACVFFTGTENSCRIYKNRPMECRVLKCWDTREIETIYCRNLLTRKALLSGMPDLWALIEDHDRQCSYEMVQNLLYSGMKISAPDRKTSILEMIQYDRQIRILVVEKAGMDPDLLDFILGRPLLETVRKMEAGIRR